MMGTHSMVDRGTCRSFMMAGRAMFTILPSRVDMNTPTATSEKTNHLLTTALLFILVCVNTYLGDTKNGKTWMCRQEHPWVNGLTPAPRNSRPVGPGKAITCAVLDLCLHSIFTGSHGQQVCPKVGFAFLYSQFFSNIVPVEFNSLGGQIYELCYFFGSFSTFDKVCYLNFSGCET